jgi:outer membrane receptor protein involved in Fe transport
LNHEQKLGKFNTETDITFFLTSFDNQIVIDLEDNNQLNFYNLKGRSSAYSFQIDQKWIFHKNFDVKLSYKNDFVQSFYTSSVLNKPLIIRDKILFNPEWRFNKDKMKVSSTFLLNSQSRIPIKTDGVDSQSPWFAIWHALFTWMPNKQTDIYFGAENILNYRQRVLILGANDPYGQNFDAGMIWGPADGRRFYMGIKWKLNYK